MNIKTEIKRHNYDIKSLNENKRQNVDVTFCLNHYGLVSHKYDLPKQSVFSSSYVSEMGFQMTISGSGDVTNSQFDLHLVSLLRETIEILKRFHC